jgi:ATP-GRASP peptide maturase of grasp-with-spasm system
MTLIISEENDVSTGYVMDYLAYYNEPCIRVNEKDFIQDIYLQLFSHSGNECIVQFGTKKVNLSKIKSFWFRRGGISFDTMIHANLNPELITEINKHLKEECQTIEQFLVCLLKTKKTLGDIYQRSANKLIGLFIAQSVGLQIPNTIVSTEKQKLSNFFENQTGCISKFIQDVFLTDTQENRYYSTTSIVEKSDILEMNDRFFPSQLQANIPKRYELRIFYLNGKCYSMVIFSQQDKQTQVDFRNYNHKKPNRNVPYKLPEHIENKINKFMQLMNLDTGSIDMIVTPDLEYVFLEVNPVGQYDMVSVPCNYYLDKKIAKYLKDGE